MTIIQGLIGEHAAIYPLLQLIEDSAESDSLDELKLRTSCLRSTLSGHARTEDELLLPVILEHLPKMPSGQPSDHAIIDGGLTQVLEAADPVAARRALLAAVAKTREHFMKEETFVFGIANSKLPAALLEELGVRWAQARGVALG